MSHFRGKGGKLSALRHNQSLLNVKELCSDQSIRRMAQRGGAKRLSKSSLDEQRQYALRQLKILVNLAICYTLHARRKTLYAIDIKYAARRMGTELYGVCESDWLKTGAGK